MFRSAKGDDTYCFSLSQDGSLDELFIRREERIVPSDEFTPFEKTHAQRLVEEASPILKEQLSTWSSLGTSERLSLLISWGEDQIKQLRSSIHAAIEDSIDENSEEIELMLRDLVNHHSYIAGLETALSLL